MVLDNRLNKIDNVELEEDINNHLTQVSKFLIKLSSEKNAKAIRDRMSHIEVVALRNDESIACRRVNGKVREFEVIENAWVTVGNVTTANGTTYTDSYIYLRERANSHQKRHESVHALTTVNKAEKVDENIYAFKKGLRRSFCKTSTGDLLEGEDLYEDGDYIDEGLTDYMTYLSEGVGIEDSPYIQNVLLATFLTGGDIGPNNNLIQAFTSDSVQDIKEFETDFDSYSEDGLKYKDIAQFKAHSNSSQQYLEMLIASIRYRIRSAKTQEMIKRQIQFYMNLIEEMNENNKFRFNLWTIFEDDIKSIFLNLQEEMKKQQQGIKNCTEDRDGKVV